MKSVAALAESLRETADAVKESRLVEDAAGMIKATRQLAEQLGKDVTATTARARDVTERVGRVVDRIERGPGLAHTLLYEEPLALQRLNEAIAAIQALLTRVERGEGAVGVLTPAGSNPTVRGRPSPTADRGSGLPPGVPETRAERFAVRGVLRPSLKSTGACQRWCAPVVRVPPDVRPLGAARRAGASGCRSRTDRPGRRARPARRRPRGPTSIVAVSSKPIWRWVRSTAPTPVRPASAPTAGPSR